MVLPDSGPRLFSFSRLHGPSALDAVGAVILTAGWIVLDVAIWRRRSWLGRGRKPRLVSLVAAVAIGLLVLVPSILLDLGLWWIGGIALLAGAQVATGLMVTPARVGSPDPG